MHRVWEFSFEDSLVLVRLDTADLYVLNPSAALLWRLLQRGEPLRAIVAIYAAHFHILDQIAAQDVNRTWHEWGQTLLAPVSAPSPISPFLVPLPDSQDCCRNYRLLDKSIRVCLHDQDLIAEIAPRLESLLASPSSQPHTTLHATSSEGTYHVFSGTTCVATENHPADARVIFLQELVRSAHADSKWAAILHAGACGTERRCVIFPAETHSGKTTLAAACMHRGLTFYADDSVLLEAGSFTVPVMPFALMIREGSWPEVSARFPEFADAPVHERYGQKVRFLPPICPPHDAKAHPAAIVFSQWQAGAGTTITTLDHFDALVRLKDSGFWVAHDRDAIQSFLDWLQSLPVYEMVYSDLDEAVAFIRKLVST